MLDKYMIAHCAYTCDAKAKQLLKERLKADAEGRSGDSRILRKQREEYLYLKEYFLRFLRPTFRTYEFVVTTEDQWERYRPVELSVPCYHYVVGDIHIPLFLQDDELDIDVPLFSHSYTPENHAVEPLPDHVLHLAYYFKIFMTVWSCREEEGITLIFVKACHCFTCQFDFRRRDNEFMSVQIEHL